MKQNKHILFFAKKQIDNSLFLDESDSRHAILVLRLSRGDKIICTDGLGNLFNGTIINPDKNKCEIAINNKKKGADIAPQISLYVGLPSKSAFENLIPITVPLGVLEIIPVECEYCQEKWWNKKWEKISDRITKKIVSASKQSLRTQFPKLNTVVKFKDAIQNTNNPIIFADENGLTISELDAKYKTAEQISCFIGPPGGFSPHEIETLKKHNAQSLKLSNNRLRTELASASAITLLSQLQN